MQHAHYFGAFFVHRQGIEIVDLDIRLGTNRMRQRAGVLGELPGAQGIDVLDAFDGERGSIAGELLITEYREAFFQAQLEPVAASHAVA